MGRNVYHLFLTGRVLQRFGAVRQALATSLGVAGSLPLRGGVRSLKTQASLVIGKAN